jgi:nitrous oxidase accessory protein NosD
VITGWQPTTHRQLPSEVYEADVSTLPLTEEGIHHLFVDGQLMTIARYPNVNSPLEKNWLTVDATAGKNGFTDQALVDYRKPDDYWKGATLRIRNYSWTYMVTEITGFNASTGKITAERLSNQLSQWGYFIDNKLTELDQPGEWYYDAAAQKVYFYPQNGQNPNNLSIEGSTFNIGIQLRAGQNRAKIEQLNFRHYTDKGVHIGGVEDALLQECHFEHNDKGVYLWNSPNVVVKNNTLTDQLQIGIVAQAETGFDVKQSVVENNQITYTSMYRGYGDRDDGVYQGLGISVSGKAYTIRQNIIEDSSHGGIALKGEGSHLIENNVIRRSLLLLNDGGAIVIGSDANVIRGNLLLDTIGNIDESNGCATESKDDSPCPIHPSYGMGIGANPNDSNGTVIENNTIANNAHQGVRLNSFVNSTVHNNVFYNNNSDQLVIEDKFGSQVSRNNSVENNIFYMLTRDKQLGIKLTNDTRHGTLENNYYCNPYNEIILERDSKVYSLAYWQASFSYYDQKSTQCDFHFDEYQVTEVSPSVLTNSSFDTTISDWKKDVEHDTTQTLLDGGSLKATFPTGSDNATVLSPSFPMTEGQLYRLKFSVVGNGFGTIRLRINDVAPDAPERLLWERNLAYDETRKEYEWFFTSPVTTSEGKILLTTYKEDARIYWLDNVTFEPVTATKNDPTQKSVLFINPEATPKTIDLKGVTYSDLDSKTVTGSITLQPFTSQILIYISGDLPPSTTKPVLTINKTGTGTGTVTANAGLGSGINCGTSCLENYEMNSQITLTATPDANSQFAGWEGIGCGDTVTITTDMTCTAIFNSTTTPPPQEDYTISITIQGDGTISSQPKGISCGNTCSATFPAGTAITLIPSSNLDSQFVGFTGDSVCTNAQIVLDQNVNCVANFEPSFAKPFVAPVCTPNNQGSVIGVCNAQGGQLNDTKIEADARVSRVELTGDINNDGWLSNVTVKPEATVSGGKVTGYVTNEGTMKDFEFRGAKLKGGTLAGNITSHQDGTFQDVQLAAETKIEGGKLAGQITGDSQSPATLEKLQIKSGTQLSDVILGEEVKVAEGIRLSGHIQNTGGNTLNNVQFDANAQLTGGQLSGKIEGNLEGMSLLEELTIEANSQLSQVIIGNNVQLSDKVVLIDSEFRGQTLTGVTVGGTLQNTGEGTIQEINFQKDTQIIGGKVAGSIKGNSRAKVELQQVEVQAGSELSDVIIGENVQLPADVVLERGKVHFANSSAIPTDFELMPMLPTVSSAIPCGEQITLPERVDLNNHILVTDNNSSIIGDINNMADVQAESWQMTQNPVYGYLQTIQDDTLHIALQPVSLKRASEEGEQMQIVEQQQTLFTTATGMTLITEPAIQAPCDLQGALAGFGLPQFSLTDNGNLKIPAGEEDWFSARPDWASTPAVTEQFPGIYFSPSTVMTNLSVVTLNFLAQNGELREQKLYPTVAVPEALNAVAEEIATEADNGLINFSLNGQNYRGMMDYLVTMGTSQPENLQLETQTDLNGDNIEDITLIYPTGERQNMFLMPTE